MSRDLGPHRCRRRHQGGFTLIELLVIIVILGILSAVVVFAVRGSNDQARDNAAATDERTLRTAEEVFCARFGQYGTERQLAGAEASPDGQKHKFISEESEYNDIDLEEPGDGPCNGWRYDIIGIDPNDPPPGNVACEPGLWCQAAPPGHDVQAMVQLPSGKVLAIGEFSGFPSDPSDPMGLYTEVFDPSSASGSWVPGPLAPTEGGGWLNTMVLIGGDGCGNNTDDDGDGTADDGCPGGPVADDKSEDLCSPNCGKVLVGMGGHPAHWELYDPTVVPVGRFGRIEGNSYSRNHSARAVQIIGTTAQCGANCGKVLIVGGGGEGSNDDPVTPPVAELWDPATNAFEKVIDTSYRDFQDWRLAPLEDGRVLMVGFDVAQLFDPLTGLFDDAATPDLGHDGSEASSQALTMGNGDVLATGYDPTVDAQAAEIYHPDARGASSGIGTWTTVPSCGPNSGCYLLAALPNGLVLARSSGDDPLVGECLETIPLVPGQQGCRPTVQLFDPDENEWRLTGSMADERSGGSAVLLSKGACAPNCNRVLAAGAADVPAEMYTP